MDENKNTLEDRVNGFNEELAKLLQKYRLALGALPFISKDGRILANPHLFDDIKVEKTN